jgi:RNAse (barnase) inhibitor barstar
MKTIIVDCTEVDSPEKFWEAYVTAANPEGAAYFGRNLDAFWDAVSAGGPGWPGECELKFTNTDGVKKLRGGSFYASLRRIADECKSVSIAFE